jgi:hypothetical protein
MANNDTELPSINVLTFWGTLCRAVNNDDFEQFKSLLDTKFSSIDDDKYATAMLLVKDKYEYLHYLIIEHGVKRNEIEQDIINPVSEKLFLLQELMAENNENQINKNKSKI